MARHPLTQPIVDPSAGWTYPEGYALAEHGHGLCRSCGASIAWMVHLRTQRRSPWNPDGTSHFSSCPQADHWRGKGSH